MIEAQSGRVSLLENAQDYAAQLRHRRQRIALFTGIMLILMLAIMVVVRELVPNALPYSPILAIGAFCVIMLPVVIWNQPRVGLYVLVAAACLFIQTPPDLNRDPFTLVPFFWNISTTVEHYTHGSKALSFMHLNFGEVIMTCTALFWFMRQILKRQVTFYRGIFFGWFGLYLVWCGFGFVHGIANGGDITIALWELRAQAYFALAYLLACNLITDRKHALTILWVMAVCIGMKSLVGLANYIADPHAGPDVGVLSHEDSLLLNIIFYGALLLGLARVEPKLKWFFILFLPSAAISALANGRRAGIAAFIVAFPVVVAMSAVLLKERRKTLIGFLVAATFATAIYLPLAWNSQGVWALPARSIKSQTDPNGRDASSDSYRMAENANLKQTRDGSPWFGYGYGRPYFNTYTQIGRTDPFTYILPHNGILWIWMRLGNIGFILFWMFVATVLVRGPELLKAIRDPRLQIIGILSIGVFLMNIIYGQYDLTFANYRVSWLTGTMLGMLAVLPRLVTIKQQERAAGGFARSGTEGDTSDDLDVREVDEEAEIDSNLPEWQRNMPGPARPNLPGWTRGNDW